MNKTLIAIIAVSTLILGGCSLVKETTINQLEVEPTIIEVPTIAVIQEISPEPTVDETETIKIQIKEALVAKHGSGANSLTVTVSKIEGNYSKGGAAVLGEGGGMWFGAKVDGQWKLVWDGNGIITCSDLTDYPNYPATFIPECYNTTTDKLVKR
jgi:hypothetical protein